MRFRISNPPASDLELPDLEALLDALESALVTPETPVFDAARQSWQPAGRHPEARAAWAERARYLPPGARRPQLPPPPEEAPDEVSEREQPALGPDGLGDRRLRRRPLESSWGSGTRGGRQVIIVAP